MEDKYKYGVSEPQYREVVAHWCSVEEDTTMINSKIEEVVERSDNFVVEDDLQENILEEPDQDHFADSALSNAEEDQLLLLLSRWGHSMVFTARKCISTRMIREIH